MKPKTPLDTALHFLKYRARSEFEVDQKLRLKGFSEPERRVTLKKLKSAGLLNDLDFAKMWLENRNELHPEGSKLLFLEMKRLGISEDIIKKVLDEDNISEIKKAKLLIQQKSKIMHILSESESRQKMIAFLARRGFSWETISQVLKIN